MLPTRSGSIRLFRFAGIDVFVHWTWLLAAVFLIQTRQARYQQWLWNVAEYLALFAIVLMHEFGHALACRQVGGKANQIVLWPLGGVAYVAPPQRPGPVLWSIAAGPLVNLLLVPVTIGASVAFELAGQGEAWPDVRHFLFAVTVINGVLLVFNLMPVFPLDGGQILRALLWFVIGPARSLSIASGVGLVAGLCALVLALFGRNMWFGILAAFVILQSWNGWRVSRAMLRMLQSPIRPGFRCPACGLPPPQGPFWICLNCRRTCDLFEHGGACHHCGATIAAVACPHCQRQSPTADWTSERGETRADEQQDLGTMQYDAWAGDKSSGQGNA